MNVLFIGSLLTKHSKFEFFKDKLDTCFDRMLEIIKKVCRILFHIPLLIDL